MMNGRVTQLRRWVLVLAAVVMIVAIGLPVMVGFYGEQQQQQVTQQIVCVSARANIEQLQAQAALHRRLGVPIDFEIPTLPEECR